MTLAIPPYPGKSTGSFRIYQSKIDKIIGYTRKDGTKVDGHLRISGGFTIDGREFSIFVGSEDIEKYFPNTSMSAKRANKCLNNTTRIKGTDFGI